MIHSRLSDFLAKKPTTLLGVGPMSLNCINASIELANTYEIPIFLIASRRQIDSIEFGGGYVNNWTTMEFANYVIENDKKGKILLSRDHGGPWQNNQEINQQLSLRSAMESAKLSLGRDIEAGFQVLHLDPSIDIHRKPNVDEVLDRLYELYDYCWSKAQSLKRDIIFEIGTEEQSGSTNTQDELDYVLNSLQSFCNKNKFHLPSFVVIQTGTRVMEARNIGSFDSVIRVADELPAEIQVPKMIEICNRYGIFMKEHNADYLSDEALKWHPRLGIHAANVAPEFGVTETKALLKILDNYKLKDLSDQFIQLANNSKRWDKWMLPNSSANDRDRAIICGHYIFSTPECHEIKNQAQKHLFKKGVNLNEYLTNTVKESILRYLINFRLLDLR
jgi:hypothetical protein